MTSQFVPTVTNMVTLVQNIIQGYRMGSIRALAQEPVQNSKDAARGQVQVEYRLHKRSSADGTEWHMLTVTDCNTSGLDGPVLSFEDIQKRGNLLGRDDNWAAFEGMGYTKEDESALGSRGQGKAAFLYHSRMPQTASYRQDRMMILYDSLLADGGYRLGIRYANPFDTVQYPPFSGDQARSTVSSHYTSADGTEIDLALTPLASVGTRIIVPYLSQEAVEAIHSGELYEWLQRCWWRAVQTGLKITVVDELGNTKPIVVPSWWQAELWKRPRTGSGMSVYNNLDVANALKIKRMVLLYDESLNDSDIESVSPQFCGVQLLRGQQWIETLGLELSDYIPRDKRPGFRGFAEFDRLTERELRRAENSQHESFDRRWSGIKSLIYAIENTVKDFAASEGWTTRELTRPASGAERTAALEFLRLLSPNARRQSDNGKAAPDSGQLEMDFPEADRWQCDLRLDFPDPNSPRVDWGQHLRNVDVEVKLEPTRALEHATVSLELSFPEDKISPTPVESLELDLRDGYGSVRFGDFQVITGKPAQKKLQCARKGKYKLTARVQSEGAEAARSSRSFYVREAPPAQGENPYTISISAQNHTTPEHRIDSGHTVGVQVSVTNRTAKLESFGLNASLGDLLLADMQKIHVDGTPPGASPVRVAGVQTQIVVNPAEPTAQQFVHLAPGKHHLRADLFLKGEVVAHASRTVYVETDPVRPDDWPPFRIEQISGGGHHPRWQFQKTSQDDWILQYPPTYPLYRALDASPTRNGTRLAGVSAFVVDVCAEGIIEWALEPLDVGNSSRLEELLGGAPSDADPDRWEDYREKMEELATLRRSQQQVDRYAHLVRECAALSLSLFEEHG